MRLLYVYRDVSKQSGVFNKVQSHINGLFRDFENSEIEVLIFGERINSGAYSGFKAQMHMVEIPKFQANPLLRTKPFWGILYEKELWNTYKSLLPSIIKLNPDIIVLRDFAMSQSGIKLLQKLNQFTKVVLESNTLIDSELVLKALENNWYKVEYLKEKKWRHHACKHIAGVIAVTNELAEQYRVLGFENEKIHIFSNGIEVLEKELNDFPNSEEIRGVFLAGTGSNWNGVDRLIESLKRYTGKEALRVDVLGISGESQDFGNNTRIEYCSVLTQQQLNSAISKYHFGISTLALYRKGMKEASALKVRTYLANGLPIVLAYDDTDINEILPFVYNASNDSTPLKFELIFSQFWGIWKNNTKEEIYLFAKKNLDFKNKQIKLIAFLDSIHFCESALKETK